MPPRHMRGAILYTPQQNFIKLIFYAKIYSSVFTPLIVAAFC